jgi:hypothetical protein
MSPRAAWRLDALGFGEVYDYAPGKADWAAAGLPLEGRTANGKTAGGAADAGVPTCTIADDLREVRDRVRGLEWDECIVINERRIVLGRLGRAALERDDSQSVEEAMSEGPSTVRPDTPLDELPARLVTTSDGVLIGVVRRPS